jgi:hypothetical protein
VNANSSAGAGSDASVSTGGAAGLDGGGGADADGSRDSANDRLDGGPCGNAYLQQCVANDQCVMSVGGSVCACDLQCIPGVVDCWTCTSPQCPFPKPDVDWPCPGNLYLSTCFYGQCPSGKSFKYVCDANGAGFFWK